jgi:predicted outer membrane repeat protein
LFYASDPLVPNEITITDSSFDNNSCILGIYNGLGVNSTRGGAIYSDRTNLNIFRCSFTNNAVKFLNSGSATGGAINVGSNNVTKIDKCNFINNKAHPYITGNSCAGGAIEANSEITISNCVFEGNHSAGSAGAIELTTTGTTKNKMAVANCVFISNTADFNGGAIYYGTSQAFYPTGFTNLTFYANNASIGGAFYFNLISQIQQTPTTQVKNCIFQDNAANEIAYRGTSDSSKILKSNNLYQTDNFSGSLFQNSGNPIGNDGIWRTVDDGLQLNSCSLFVNSGTNAGLILPGTVDFWTQDDLDITGKARVRGAQVDIGAYESDSNAVSFQTITLAATDNKNFGDNIYTLPLNTSAGLPVTYSSSNPEIVSISGNVVKILKVGKTTITANQAGNECNKPMLETTQILTVSPKIITINGAVVANKVYDGTTVANISGGILVGVLSADDVTLTQSGTFDNQNTGIAKVIIPAFSIGGSSADNYSLAQPILTADITPKPITIAADPKSKVYGATDPVLTYQITAGALIDGDTLNGALNRTLGQNVETTYIITSTLNNVNYDVTYVPANFAIKAKSITIAADPKSKVYGATDPVLTYQITAGALIDGDALNGALNRTLGENVGTTYMITSTFNNANYDITYVPAYFAIRAKPITITADPKSKVYGATDPVLTYQITAGALIDGDALNGDLNRTLGENVGTTYMITSTFNNANYDVTYVPAYFVISKAILTITANNQTRVFGAANPVLTIIYSGFVNGDSETNLNIPAKASTMANSTSLEGIYEIKVDQAVSDNYNFNYVNGTLRIISSLETNTSDTVKFSYYPNPVKDVLNISLTQEITRIDVFNMLGQQVMSQSVHSTKTKLDMSSLKIAWYLVEVIYGSKSKVIKIIKVKQ